MFAEQIRTRLQRRGIILVVVLGMLGLLALIGVTFATFSGQAQVNARNYALSDTRPDPGHLMDFALAQLVNDTNNPQSAIRGHSLKRDMYGNDAVYNGFVAGSSSFPSTPMLITSAVLNSTATPPYVSLVTNLNSNDPAFYGMNFTRWTIRMLSPPAALPLLLGTQTVEVLVDDRTGTNITFHVAPTLDTLTTLTNANVPYNNLPATPNGLPLVQPGTLAVPFVLDSRYRHAFNGSGMGSLGLDISLPGSTVVLPASAYANFRFNGGVLAGNPNTLLAGNPGLIDMDEDYDAVDLENWFLAMQSADGQVIIPSFHRPGIIIGDPTNPTNPATNDWQNSVNSGVGNFAASMSKILRPRNADGHNPLSFPDLIPNTANGKINYDVDNDGDGVTDSVWLDLGYPIQRSSTGQLYKPLFAFMVIGLNGRMPLNTAGNIATNNFVAGQQPNFAHASHLGNSVSEIDITYALQNAYDRLNWLNPLTNYFPSYSQTDNAGSIGLGTPNISVANTQLLNILAGTRPQVSPFVDATSPQLSVPGTTMPYTFVINQGAGPVPYSPATSSPFYTILPIPAGQNLDTNLVAFGLDPVTGKQQYYALPNGLADAGDNIGGLGIVTRYSEPVAGRWGEQDSVPGLLINYVGMLVANGQPTPLQYYWNNTIRAGLSQYSSYGDARDDNYNTFDPFPINTNVTPNVIQGESPLYNTSSFAILSPADLYDNMGALLLPVENYRRFVTPMDINGTGSIQPYSGASGGLALSRAGADISGRVAYANYFRPPGLPVAAAPDSTYALGVTTYNLNGVTGLRFGFPSLPDVANNYFHGYESQRNPNSAAFTPVPGYSMQAFAFAGAPTDMTPGAYPPMTYDSLVNSGFPGYTVNPTFQVGTDGFNEADEMNLYNPSQYDAPFGPADLQWLYRKQDVDGSALHSRLSNLAPISFNNSLDGIRRKRLFATDSWDLNTYVYAYDSPSYYDPNATYNTYLGANAAGSYKPFLNNNRFAAATQASLFNQGGITPAVAQPQRKVNLNFPLPVSNSPIEPVRQKWIRETYQLLKQILPPSAVDTPQELAQLSQYVVNIIDFRDPDGTMTKFVNTDLVVVPASAPAGGTYLPPRLAFSGLPDVVSGIAFAPPATYGPYSPLYDFVAPPTGAAMTDLTQQFLVQFGMEYNPIAINETFAYSFQYKNNINTPGTPAQAYRFFVELVNTLTQSGSSPDPSFVIPNNWDIVITNDDPLSRPDPISGQLAYNNAQTITPATAPAVGALGSSYGPIPLTDANAVTPTVPGLSPLPAVGSFQTPLANYYYTLGNNMPAGYNTNATQPAEGTVGKLGTPNYILPDSYINTTYDLFASTSFNPYTLAATDNLLFPLANTATSAVPQPAPGSASANYYWVCLRRPANPLAAPTGNTGGNPMVVVDSMRFPYIEGGGMGKVGTPPTNQDMVVQPPLNQMYSAQRMQPYRGGHAVPIIPGSPVLNTAYGYSEQTAVPLPSTTQGNFGNSYNQTPGYVTNVFNHSINFPNANPDPQWDWFVFNDRDFTSVAELALVPGAPPGLFTKQFVEFAPTNPFPPAATIPVFNGPALTYPPSKVLNTPITTTNPAFLPSVATTVGPSPATGGYPFNQDNFGSTIGNLLPMRTYPYLIDNFFYTGASEILLPETSGAAAGPGPPVAGYVGGPSGAGWYRMFDFFEVPSLSNGAIGPVQNGDNFDWQRQDVRPGLLNLNLIIDEEVFFGLMGRNPNIAPLSTAEMITPQNPNGTGTTSGDPLLLNNPYLLANMPALVETGVAAPFLVPKVVTMIDPTGSPAFLQMLANGSPLISAYPMSNVGALETTPAGYSASVSVVPVNGTLSTVPDNRMKAAFADFLKLRHGGSGYMFGFGTGAVYNIPAANLSGPIAAERPFHSLSYPDINYTILRPATLPPPLPNAAGTVLLPATPVPLVGAAIPYWPAGTWPYTGYSQDPGMKNPYLSIYNANVFSWIDEAVGTGYTPSAPYVPFPLWTQTAPVPQALPPAVPPRRLFQIPDYVGSVPVANFVAGNASYGGDLNVNTPYPNTTLSNSSPFIINGATGVSYPALTPPTRTGYLGGRGVNVNRIDTRQHPYFRTEWLQRVMNLTTVRTHQYAVWITVGFFEITRAGNPQMAFSTNPLEVLLSTDILGLELNLSSGRSVRHRGFFLVDRTKAIGFNPTLTGNFRDCVVYRQIIE